MAPTRVALALTVVMCIACGDKKDPAPAASSVASTAKVEPPAIDAGFAVWPATLEDRAVEIESRAMKTALTGRVPSGWISRSAGAFTIPDGGNPSPTQPSIDYAFGSVSCGAKCDDKAVQQAMAETWKLTEKGYAQVSSNSGNERMDTVKLDVKTLDEGTFEDGKYKAVKVTRPADAQDVPAFLERLEAECVRHRKGDKFYIVARVITPHKYEQTLWPLLLEACKTPWFR